MELTPFLKGISYHAAHFDVLMLKRPEQCRKLLEEARMTISTAFFNVFGRFLRLLSAFRREIDDAAGLGAAPRLATAADEDLRHGRPERLAV